MALGMIADTNLALTATLTGGNCAGALPLNNLKTDSRFVGAPARFLGVGTLANTTFEVELANVRSVNLVYLMFTTLSLGARWRISVISPGGSFATPDYQSAWLPAYGALNDSWDMAFEEENWFTGQLPSAEIDLCPRNVFATLPSVLAAKIRIEINDAANAAGELDIGGLFIASTFSPAVNYERGHELGLDARGVTDEAPSGRFFTEVRRARRVLSVNYDMLTTIEARRWFDAGARAQDGRTVIFIPNADDEPGRIREAFPAVMSMPKPRFIYATKNPLALTFREILA